MTWDDIEPCPRCSHRHTSTETSEACARRHGDGQLHPAPAVPDLFDRWLPVLLETGRVFEFEADPGGRVRVAVAEGTSAMPVPAPPDGDEQLAPPHEPGDAHITGPHIRAARR